MNFSPLENSHEQNFKSQFEQETEIFFNNVQKVVKHLHSEFREKYPFQFPKDGLPIHWSIMEKYNASICSSYSFFIAQELKKQIPNIATQLLNVEASIHHNFTVISPNNIAQVYDINTSNVEADRQNRYIWADHIDQSRLFIFNPKNSKHVVFFEASDNQSQESLSGYKVLWNTRLSATKLYFLAFQYYLSYKEKNSQGDNESARRNLIIAQKLNQKVITLLKPDHNLARFAQKNLIKIGEIILAR
jgi:hypothetical protein